MITGTRLQAILAGALLLAALAIGCGESGGDTKTPRPEAARGAPNVITIVIDDATRSMITPESMPFTTKELLDRGTDFTDFIAVSPLCCPSRANYLTGQYGHNNGVLRNNYVRLRKKGQILPRWLQNAGYKTIHVGKYLNSFTNALDPITEVPAGWDEWFTTLENRYYDYPVSDNGELVEYGSEPDDYLTRVINDKAVEMVDDYATRDRPFYMQIDQYAPHLAPQRDGSECEEGTVPDPKELDGVGDWPIPASPNRNEKDVSDKPWFVRQLDRMNKQEIELANTRFQCATASLPAVDRGVRMLFEALEEAGELENTAFFFTSDNGYFFGEHRIPWKKEFAYEENLRMPLFVRMPKDMQPTNQQVSQLTGTIDVAPTILEIAKGDSCTENDNCRLLDGRSLLPLIEKNEMKKRKREWPADRALLVELDQAPKNVQKRARPCSYFGVRTADRLYVQHRLASAVGTPCKPTSDVEHYDLNEDPYQLDNLSATNSDRDEERRLRRLAVSLEECAGNESVDDGPDVCQ